CRYVCRVLDHLAATGTTVATPRLRASDRDMPRRPYIDDFSSGYVRRAVPLLPKQGDREPWLHPQDLTTDRRMLNKPVDDGVLQFTGSTHASPDERRGASTGCAPSPAAERSFVATAPVTESQRSTEESGDVAPTCPKHMVYGPCGGVRIDGRCEVDDRACPFVGRPVVAWSGPTPAPTTTTFARAVGRNADSDPTPIIVTDLRVRPFDRASVTAIAGRLAATADALLIGEHHVRPDFPPTVMAELVGAAGARPWVTLTCRDRNRVVLESELAGLAEQGVAGVHCVTGDSRARSVRTDATQVFDLDGTRLAGLAQQVGLCTSVTATPVAPPTHLRPARLLEKQRAGAHACFVNHAGGADGVAQFVGAAREIGVTMPFVPCVAVITDVESLVVLERFPGLVVDPELRRAVLEADDGRAAGIAAAVQEAQRMLAIDGVVGVNLSGSATAGPETESAAIMAEVAATLRDRLARQGP
ncbi:MAG: methylenetetrahydrofolate reductase C-terminal domain-containing protein, partial [Ilumatobacteraceae bacterium]